MKKSVILVVVVGIMLVLSTLALVALSLMTSESRIAEHKIRRTRAYYAAQAGIVDGLEQLRRGVANGGRALPATGDFYTINVPGNTRPTTVVVVARGQTFNVGATPYTCAATAPSPYCVFATIDYQ
jgi:Tfp pilus assembly protein PilX